MKKSEFIRLFVDALEEAAQVADGKLNRTVSRNFEVELHGAGHIGDRVAVQQAAEDLYLGEEKFYRVIDVAALEVGPHRTLFFVRASGHEPRSFDETWNQPPGSGPFKQIEPVSLRVISD